jgi:hypothetical protein
MSLEYKIATFLSSQSFLVSRTTMAPTMPRDKSVGKRPIDYTTYSTDVTFQHDDGKNPVHEDRARHAQLTDGEKEKVTEYTCYYLKGSKWIFGHHDGPSMSKETKVSTTHLS